MAEENAGFLELIAKVSESNEKLHEVERHTRNSRRHLLEMKKSVFDISAAAEVLASPDTENRREDIARQERLIKAVEHGGKGVAGSAQRGGGGGGGKGLLGGFGGGALGGFLGAAGMGAGAATAGLGVLMAGGGYLLEKLAEFDGEKVKKNVMALTEIGDEMVAKSGSMKEAYKDGGLLMFMLGGLGTALIAFGLGSGLNAAVEKFAGDTNWAENTKANVVKLMEIADLGYTAGSVTGVSAALAGLGVGLALFGAGQLVATAGMSASAAVEKFQGTDGFAENTVKNVKTLLALGDSKWGDIGKTTVALGMLGIGLAMFGAGKAVASVGDVAGITASALGDSAGVKSFMDGGGFGKRVYDEVSNLLAIGDLKNATLGGGFAFVGTMGAISLGLVAYTYGKGAEALGSVAQTAASKAASYFGDTENTGFAQRVVNEVTTLLEIGTLPFGNTVGFVATMTAISGGLAVFAAGKGLEALVGFLGNMTGGEGKSQAERVKEEVNHFLSLGENKDVEQAKKAAEALGIIGDSLSIYAGKGFAASLKGAGSAIVDFFSGGKNPMDEVLTMAEKADDLTKAGTAIGKVATNLEKVMNISVQENTIDIKKFAENLKEAVPIIEGAIYGQKAGWVWGEEIKGLAYNSMAYNAAKDNLFLLRSALGENDNTTNVTNNYYGPSGGGADGNVLIDSSTNSYGSPGGMSTGSAHGGRSDLQAVRQSIFGPVGFME